MVSLLDIALICINQDDTRERSSQVELMGRIWRQAQKAIVWLGEELDSAGAINWLHVLALTKTWCDRARLRYVSDAKFNAQWQALQNLLLRPWWTRAWTLQEFVIAPELKFYCGRKSIRRSRFKSAMYVIWLCEGMNHKSFLPEGYDSAWNRRRLHMWYALGEHESTDNNSSQMFLLAMMAYIGNCKATDPRDYIYSLLSLAKDRGLVGQPDYDSEVSKVYLRLVEKFIKTYKSLDVICFAPLFNRHAMGPSTEPVVPSWVPDWRAQVEPLVEPLMASQSARSHIGNFRPVDAIASDAAYTAGGIQTPQITFSQDLGIMTCEGLFIDHIDGLGGLKYKYRDWSGKHERVEHEYPSVQSTSPKNYSGEVQGDLRHSNNSPIQSSSGLMDSLTHCLVLDRRDRYLRHESPRSFVRDFQMLCLATVERPGDVDPLFLDWFRRNRSLRIQGRTLETLVDKAPKSLLPNYLDVMERSDGDGFLSIFLYTTTEMARRLIVTNEGHIGMAPSRAKKGDIICVLLGCSIPACLRKREADASYEFIGECYVHGLMNGEIIEELESGRRKIEHFRLS